MYRRIVASMLLLAVAASASADYFTGNDVEKHLLNTGRVTDIAMFRGYVAGVSDVYNGKLFCAPPDVELSQASAVVKKYLSENPRLWNEPAKVLVIQALESAYPCSK